MQEVAGDQGQVAVKKMFLRSLIKPIFTEKSPALTATSYVPWWKKSGEGDDSTKGLAGESLRLEPSSPL